LLTFWVVSFDQSLSRCLDASKTLILLSYALRATDHCGSTNIFVGGRLRLSCGRSRKVYVLIAVNSVSSRYICGFIQYDSAVAELQRTAAWIA